VGIPSRAVVGFQVVVEVRDTGIGIPPEERPRTFDRFYQVESASTRRYGGIGLGLAIVRQILDAHGCAVEVDSEIGKGSALLTPLLPPFPVDGGDGGDSLGPKKLP
jgi:signal transduction histidine kinase